MRRQLIGMALIWLGCGTAVWAQETASGSIAGVVTDVNGGVMPGTTVTLASDEGTRSVVTDTRGRFLAPYLTPGTYVVRAELSGFAAVEQKNVRVRLGQRVELDLTLSMGSLSETIEVTSSSPVIDTSATTAGGVLDSDMLARLPVSRQLPETLYMVSGVSSSTGTGSANPSIAGASGLDNQYVIDGVNITNQGWGALGAYSLAFGSLGSGVTTEFIKETEVKTAGFEAEYGQATGGVVNVVTRSGSNVFHGSLFGYWQPPGLEASWRQQRLERGQINTVQTNNLDFGASASGPILQDRLFYFAAFNPQYRTRALRAPEGLPLEELGEVERTRRILSYAGKVSWQITASHRLDLTLFGDPSYGESGPQRSYALRAEDDRQFSAIDPYGGDNQALRYSGILSPTWFLEGTVARAWNIYDEVPAADARSVVDYSVQPEVRSGGLGLFNRGNEGQSWQLSLRSTHMFDAGGAHELRLGVQYEDIEFTDRFAVTGPQHTFPDGESSWNGIVHEVHPDPVYGTLHWIAGFRGPPPVTTQQYLSLFAQDTWRMGARLTLRPGIRWERQRLGGGVPICFSDESFVGAGDGTPGNEVTCSYTWANNWGPRLGATFDPTSSGRSKVYASWGRFYAKVPNDLAARAMSGRRFAFADYFDAELKQPVPDHFQAFDAVPAQFASDSRMTYHDEFLAGYELEVAPMLSLGVRYIHRSIPQVLEDYGNAQLVLYDLGFEGLDSLQYFVDNITADVETLDPSEDPSLAGVPQAFFEDPVHRYDAIELTATKAFSGNWSLFASYRWSRLRGNFEGFYRADNGQSDPALTSLFDFPTNDPSYTEIGVAELGYRGDIRYQGTTLGIGPLPNDRPHQLKVYGTYAFGSLNTGVGFQAGSGQPLTALAANPNAFYRNAGEIPETLRGAGFETSDGFRTRAPAVFLLDLHADYTLAFGEQRLIFVADVFNVLNDRDPVSYNPDTQFFFPFENPDFGQPYDPVSTVSAFRTPRQVRLGVRFEW